MKTGRADVALSTTPVIEVISLQGVLTAGA